MLQNDGKCDLGECETMEDANKEAEFIHETVLEDKDDLDDVVDIVCLETDGEVIIQDIEKSEVVLLVSEQEAVVNTEPYRRIVTNTCLISREHRLVFTHQYLMQQRESLLLQSTGLI